MLICRDAASEIAFCKSAFGALELSRRSASDGSVVHATLKIGEALIMVHSEVAHLASRAPQPDGSSGVLIYVYVDDADTAMRQAVSAGARILLAMATQSWGDDVGRIVDPAGHVWNIAMRTKMEPNPRLQATAAPPRS
jgi:PhnB protein